QHPLQGAMRSTIADFAGLDAQQIPIAVDGCGVPAFFLSLHRAAYAYARLMASSEGDVPGALDRYENSAGHVVEAMTAFPYFVAGAWSMTTPLMEAYGGALLAKEGAEGFYAMAVAPNFASTLPARPQLAAACAVVRLSRIDGRPGARGRVA